MPDLPLIVNVGALPLNPSYTPQQFAQAIAERMTISTSQAFALFTSGAVLPTSDTGPHFLTTESTWYYFDYDIGSYQPIKLQPKSLRYIISNTTPSNTDYDIWYRVAADGTPLDIRKWQAGQWVAFPVDYANVSNKPNLAPIGETILWPTTTAPQDFLICNGQAVLRGQYSDLFNVIGTTFGAGDGATTFNLPDLRGRVAVGFGTGDASDATAWAIGQKKGAETHTLTTAQGPKHKHTVTAYNAGGDSTGTGYITTASLNGVTPVPENFDTSETADAAAHNNVQPSIGYNYIIRYRNTI